MALAQEGKLPRRPTPGRRCLPPAGGFALARRHEQALAEAGSRVGAAGGAPNGPARTTSTRRRDVAEDRTAMIETMVAGLDEKLRQNPRDLEGWMRLIRSYLVLGKADAARDALHRGVAALGAGQRGGQGAGSLRRLARPAGNGVSA